MINIIDFSDWEIYDGNSEGSGRSEKIWLRSNNKIGLFKYPKKHDSGEITTEHISEKLSFDIARLLDIPCATVDIGTYNGRIGSMSYRINNNQEYIVEGINFINALYPNYDIEKLYDSSNDIFYSLPMVSIIFESLHFEKEFLEMMIFDALIGNTDRHHSNWAILALSPTEFSFCPLYDNGSSLCCYIEEKNIANYLGKDKNRFNSLVDSKSRSRIKLLLKDKKEPKHTDVLRHLNTPNNYDNCISITDRIIQVLTQQKIEAILDEYPDKLLSADRKKLICKFLMEKVNLIKEIFKGG